MLTTDLNPTAATALQACWACMDKGGRRETAHGMVLASCWAQRFVHHSCRFAEAYQEKDAEEKKRVQDLKAEIKRHNQEVQDFSYGLYVRCRGRAGRPAAASS